MTPALRKILLDEMNAKQEVTVMKTIDEQRFVTTLLADDDIVTPVLPGAYLVEVTFFMIAPSPVPTSGLRFEFDGPPGVEDSALGSLAQITSDNISNLNGGGFEQAIGATFVDLLICINQSGFFRFSNAGDLTLTWGQIAATVSGTTFLQGSSLHLRRASNGIGRPP